MLPWTALPGGRLIDGCFRYAPFCLCFLLWYVALAHEIYAASIDTIQDWSNVGYARVVGLQQSLGMSDYQVC